jgi:aminopeptidase N
LFKFFRKGLNQYLTEHSFKNTLTEDLWNAFEKVSNKPVRAVMSTWTKQKGFPVITVSYCQFHNFYRNIAQRKKNQIKLKSNEF